MSEANRGVPNGPRARTEPKDEVIIADTDYSSDRLVTSVRLMIARRVPGLAALVSEMDSALINELARNGFSW